MTTVTNEERSGYISAVSPPFVVRVPVRTLLLSPLQYDCTIVSLADRNGRATVGLPVYMRVPSGWIGRHLRIATVTEWLDNGLILETQTVELDGVRVNRLQTLEDWGGVKPTDYF